MLPARRFVSMVLLALVLVHGLPATDAMAWFRKPEPEAQGPAFLPPSSDINGVKTPPSGLAPVETRRTESDVVTLTQLSDSPKQVTLTERITRLDGQPLQGSISKQDPALAEDPPQTLLRKAQNQLEQDEVRGLWEETIERNPIIRFSLEKLAVPADRQPNHSSRFLRKTLSVLVSGAAIGATMFTTGGGYTDMSILAASSALDNLLRGTSGDQPQSPLTPTEHIQLADLVDGLKLQLVDNYGQLNTALQRLIQAESRLVEANAAYNAQLAKKPVQPVDQLTQAVTYYKAQLDEQRLRQQAQLAHLELSRVAGPEPVKQLQLMVQPPTAVPSAEEPPKTGDEHSVDPPATLTNPAALTNSLSPPEKKNVPVLRQAMASKTPAMTVQTVKAPSKPLVLSEKLFRKEGSGSKSPTKLVAYRSPSAPSAALGNTIPAVTSSSSPLTPQLLVDYVTP